MSQSSSHSLRAGCALVVIGCVLSQLAPGRRLVSGNNAASSPINGK
jgi:hypothetical protein